LEKFWFKEKKKIKKNGQLLLDWLLSVVLTHGHGFVYGI
jgi:hypothetical protein